VSVVAGPFTVYKVFPLAGRRPPSRGRTMGTNVVTIVPN
jgi:hypothetical protein